MKYLLLVVIVVTLRVSGCDRLDYNYKDSEGPPGDGTSTAVALGVALGGATFVIVTLLICYCITKHQNKQIRSRGFPNRSAPLPAITSAHQDRREVVFSVMPETETQNVVRILSESGPKDVFRYSSKPKHAAQRSDRIIFDMNNLHPTQQLNGIQRQKKGKSYIHASENKPFYTRSSKSCRPLPSL